METVGQMLLRILEEMKEEGWPAETIDDAIHIQGINNDLYPETWGHTRPLNPEEEVISQAAEIDQLLAEVAEKDDTIRELRAELAELEYIRRYDHDAWNWGDQ